MVQSNNVDFKVGHSLRIIVSVNAEAVEEALASLKAVHLVRRFGFDRMMVESDSKNIISTLKIGFQYKVKRKREKGIRSKKSEKPAYRVGRLGVALKSRLLLSFSSSV